MQIVLDQQDIGKLSAGFRGELANLLGSTSVVVTVQGPAAAVNPGAQDGDRFARLSRKQAADFLPNLNPKSRDTLIAIVDRESTTFKMGEIAAAMNVNVGDLNGVWSGLTRRLRTVTGNPVAYLIYWKQVAALEDWIGEITEETRQAFRTALNLE